MGRGGGHRTAFPVAGLLATGLGRSLARGLGHRRAAPRRALRLFIIIALGESLLLTGATLEEHALSIAGIAGLVSALATAVAMWWVYFDTGARRGELALARSDEPGRLAQIAYTYLHMPIVVGIVVTAVGDEQVLADPLGQSTWAMTATILGGPALFPAGQPALQVLGHGRMPISHMAGLPVLAALAAAPPVGRAAGAVRRATVALIAVAAVEARLARSRTAAANKIT
jgi:low temperature requirement protein LtrA